MSESVAPEAPSERSTAPLRIGEIVVRRTMDEEISRLPAAVAGGTWVALPMWASFGGENIDFKSSDSNEIRLERGFWAEGDPVALWRVETGKQGDTIELSPWKQQVPLQWQSLSPDGNSLEVEIASLQKRGSFISFSLPEEIKKPGVFVQEKRIVGWTFGEWTERGYLWTGPAGSDLVPKIRVDQFYASISSNCREAYFHQALAREKGTAAERLNAIARGFRLASRLESEDLPSGLRPQSIIMEMHSLASELIQQGSAKAVIRILDDQVLMEAEDPTLVMDAVRAVAKDQDYNRAIQYLERVKKNIFEKTGQRPSGLGQFQAQLYKNWLREIIAKGGYFSGMAAFEEARRAFPDDLEIHLLGVEAALAENNWEKAKELLQMQSYPSLLKNRADQLEKRIREQEDQEAVVIRFNAGEESIRVEAYLNGTYLQNFIVDTGTNMTAIPSSAVEALGIKVDESTPVRTVLTASGMGVTYEVTLESIELKGLRVNNVKVLIINLPGFPEFGLLGLDFLNHFRFEIDKKQGILRLKKR